MNVVFEMKKLILTTLAAATLAIASSQNSNAQSWGFTLGNGAGFAYSRNGGGGGGNGGYRNGGSNRGYYNNNCGPTYIAPQYYVAPYGVTQQQRYNTPGPIIVPSYNPSYKNNQILIRPF